MKKGLLVVIVVFVAVSVSAQNPSVHVHSSEFDFWLGKWDLTWNDSLKGTNSITKILDGKIIQESFNGQPGGPLKGLSFTAFDSFSNQWKQTWVDNQGAYLDFSGGMKADSMILSRSFQRNGQTIWQRMVWFNISANHFDWLWQNSTDNKRTWKTNWQIDYKRKE
ncbi:DUF1579 domain-containing protein [bacterium]|nr:MAG: DUF1579 domain-containing protein [bacterium]